MIKNIEEEILKCLEAEQAILDEMEYTSAPSGEWEDYNHHVIVQEAVVGTIENLCVILRVTGHTPELPQKGG